MPDEKRAGRGVIFGPPALMARVDARKKVPEEPRWRVLERLLDELEGKSQCTPANRSAPALTASGSA